MFQLYEDINRFTQPDTDDISPNILSTAPGVLYLGKRSLNYTQELLEDPNEQKKVIKNQKITLISQTSNKMPLCNNMNK